MIQVINKAFDIIEFLAQGNQGKNLGEISSHLKMNAGTCANILKTMLHRKFVDQKSVRGAYMLGPMIYYLSRRNVYRGDLAVAAEKPTADLAKEVNETVLVAALRGNERFVILQFDGNQSVQVSRDFFEKSIIYRTATGRLLLAYLDEKYLKAFLTEHALPGSDWPDADSFPKLQAELAAIRRQGWVCFRQDSNITTIAYPIRENDRTIAALGLFLPTFRFKGTHKTTVLKGMKKASSAISAHLSG